MNQTLKIGSMFSGTGALDMAVESVLDAGTVWHCEWDDAAGSVMTWALLHGDPPPIIEEQVTGYVDEKLFGKKFPEIKPMLNPAFPEWLMGLPSGWITDVPGLSRADQLKAAGNGVVPQQAATALTDLLGMNSTEVAA